MWPHQKILLPQKFTSFSLSTWTNFFYVLRSYFYKAGRKYLPYGEAYVSSESKTAINLSSRRKSQVPQEQTSPIRGHCRPLSQVLGCYDVATKFFLHCWAPRFPALQTPKRSALPLPARALCSSGRILLQSVIISSFSYHFLPPFFFSNVILTLGGRVPV